MPGAIPPTGSQPPMQPLQPSGSTKSASGDTSAQDAFLLTTPWAKMFERAGATPTGKEIRGIINGILNKQIDDIKKEDAKWKEAMKKLKDIIEGNDQ